MRLLVIASTAWLVTAMPAGVQTPAIAILHGTTVSRGTVLPIEIISTVGSRTSRSGDRFVIRLAQAAGSLPAGLEGVGEVVHAAKAGGLGKAGELILAARYLDCGDVRVPLRGFRYNASGAARGGTALAVGAVIPLSGLLVRGGDVVVLAGTAATAQVATDITTPPRCPITAVTIDQKEDAE